MKSIAVIERVLRSGVLLSEMLIVPCRGATSEELASEQELLGISLCSEHITLLRRWNGIGLDVLRLFGCGVHSSKVGRLSDLQVPSIQGRRGGLVIGTDPAGFVYSQEASGSIWQLDTDSGARKQVAPSMDDWLGRVVFGEGASEFGGLEWVEELRKAHLL